MTFIELVEKVAKSTEQSKKDVKEVLYTAFRSIELTTVTMCGEVRIPGFGKFSQRKTKAGKAFGRKLTPKRTIKFTSYCEEPQQEPQMEKLGVVLDDSMTKTGAVGSQCPKCGSKLEMPNKCNVCGTEPFEKKPEPTK